MNTAFLYAAGRGMRLGTAAAGRPKILLEVGGRTLLDWHAARLAEIGIERLFIVTGYARDTLVEPVKVAGRRHGLTILEIVNPDFEEGSVLSFAVSLPALGKAGAPVLLMDADVLYPGVMLRRLVQSVHPTALLVDREYSTVDDDPVLVPIRGGRPFDFCKKWTGDADAVGESVGFFKLDPVDLPLLAKETLARVTGPGRAESYDDVLRVLVRAGCLGCEDVTGVPWTEIDFPADLRHAEEDVLPAISGMGGVAGE